MNTLETLVAARAVIANRKNWTTCVRSDSEGRHCALGAFDVALGHYVEEEPNAVLALAASMTAIEKKKAEDHWCNRLDPLGLVAQFNNTSTHAEVIALFDRTIARQQLIDAQMVPAVTEQMASV